MKFSPMLIVAGLVAVIIALVLTRSDGADVALARKETQKAIAHATSVLAANQSLKVQADSARALAADREHQAVRAEAQLAEAKRNLFRIALKAPDTCGPVVLAAQDALNKADSVIDHRTHELSAMTLADVKDRQRADSAEAALIDLRKPAAALVKASHESLLHRLRPQMAFGGMAGVDLQGKPNAVIGVGFVWHF